MSYSPLVSYIALSPNNSGRRTHKIDTITIHHMAGNLSVESCGACFAPRSRKASSNYGIGSDGRIGLYVDEDNRAWTTSSSANDKRTITIEVANSVCEEPWPVSEAAYNSLINLLVDICQRRSIKKLLWQGDKSLIGQVDKQNMTAHRWFAATNCPGDYLYSRFGQIAEEVNNKLNFQEDDYMTKEQILTELGDQFIATFEELPEWAKPDMRELLDSEIINGGTSAAVDPDDINMFLSDIKTIIVAKRMLAGC